MEGVLIVSISIARDGGKSPCGFAINRSSGFVHSYLPDLERFTAIHITAMAQLTAFDDIPRNYRKLSGKYNVSYA